MTSYQNKLNQINLTLEADILINRELFLLPYLHNIQSFRL